MNSAVDDPYKYLAHTIVVSYPEADIRNILHSTKAIKKHFTWETNNADFYGDFIDCVMVDITKHGKNRCLHKNLKDAAGFFYEFLDVPRLREEIKYYCQKYGRDTE